MEWRVGFWQKIWNHKLIKNGNDFMVWNCCAMLRGRENVKKRKYNMCNSAWCLGATDGLANQAHSSKIFVIFCRGAQASSCLIFQATGRWIHLAQSLMLDLTIDNKYVWFWSYISVIHQDWIGQQRFFLAHIFQKLLTNVK